MSTNPAAIGQVEKSEVVAELAAETLQAFETIARAAGAMLGGKAAGVESFAAINELTAARAVQNLGRIQTELAAAFRKLREEPAIARLVVADEDDRRETLYVCRATPVQSSVALCSSLGPKGRLASLPVGDFAPIRLPQGTMHYEVLEKALLRPACPGGTWDSRNTVVQTGEFGPITIASLRELLSHTGFSEEDLDILDRQLAEGNEAFNIVEGLKRSVLVAMQLRDQPILDKFQDEIFRMPIDRQLVILGPPGTGKTTTLVRRLRQKIDLEFLEEEEAVLVEQSDEGGLPHSQSWLMFTPTELLKQYVKEAFAREGVPAPEQRIRTWADHRRELARRSLPVLRSAAGGSLVYNDRIEALQPSTLTNQIAWFEDFDAHQATAFVHQIAAQAATLQEAADPAARRFGSRLASILDASSGRPIALISALTALFDELRSMASQLQGQIQDQLRRPLAQHLRGDQSLLDDLARFVATLTADASDDEAEDGEDGDPEEEEDAAPQPGRRAAQAAFIRAVRAQAVAEARRRVVPKAGRSAKVLQWLRERGVALPSLATVGETVTVQRAARRIVSSPALFIRGVPTRYRAFRRERIAAGEWYAADAPAGSEITPLELDVVLLALLRNARAVAGDTTLIRRLGDRVPQILSDVRRLQRNQILVDEATDFSPVQLACMATLANPRTDSFFACGDFNQRLTIWGSRSLDHISWTYPNVEVREIDVAYRQSRRLNELASLLTSTGGEAARSRLPEHLDNEGVPPVLGTDLSDLDELGEWLSRRICEIEDFSGKLPSIAVLVNDAAMLTPIAERLNEGLASRSIRVVACPDGQVIGHENDVRVFEVEHIKGLEFEAVFFVDVDKLEREEPDLFDKYIYVGATRAATYLGMTCSAPAIPSSLIPVSHLFGEGW